MLHDFKGQASYAHTPNARGEWNTLAAHSRRVGHLAATFARDFGASRLARIAGLLHDIGKADPRFQAYIRSCEDAAIPLKYPPLHSLTGARYAAEMGIPIVPMILDGHHAGLSDLSVLRTRLSCAEDSLQSVEHPSEPWFDISSADIRQATLPGWASEALSFEFLTRMLFSVIVDADLIDAEAHFAPHYRRKAAGNFREFVALAKQWSEEIPARLREEIHRSAENQQGVFRLKFPAGDARMRMSLDFSIRHALRNGLRRVILALPGDGAVGNVSDLLRTTVGHANVMEQYRSFRMPTVLGEEVTELAARRTSGTPRFSAPFIVTTHSHLFESLFSCKSADCRKLHGMVKSVIVVSEVGRAPSSLLPTVLDGLKELAAHYQTTLLFTSSSESSFSPGAPTMRAFSSAPVVSEPAVNVSARWKASSKPLHGRDISEEVLRHEQVLCIVDNRGEALEILDSVSDPGAFHLSSMMYPGHRRRVVSAIRNRLAAGKSCRAVATAGAWTNGLLEFPVILRSSAIPTGLADQIDYSTSGRVIIFNPSMRPESITSRPSVAAESHVAYSVGSNSFLPNIDPKGIRLLRRRLSFSTVGDLFRYTEEPTEAVVIFNGGLNLAETIDRIQCKGYAEPRDWEDLQDYSVVIPRSQFRESFRKGSIREIIPGINLWVGEYGEVTGMPMNLSEPTDLR